MSKIVEGYFHFLKVVIALCLAAMVVLVFGNVVLRYVLNMGITLSEEVSRWLFVYLTFLGRSSPCANTATSESTRW
jgi:TRAP-type C4-dicarboxylate transport system permease small subunit